MSDEVEILHTTWEMTRNLPPLPETSIVTGSDGISYWEHSRIPVDWDELIRLGYYEKRKQCPTCSGSGMLPKEE